MEESTLTNATIERAEGFEHTPRLSIDLDGTIINSDGTIDPRVIEPLRDACGWAKIYLNSDTSEGGLENHCRRLGIDRRAFAGFIVENGAATFKKDGSAEQHMSDTQVDQITALLAEMNRQLFSGVLGGMSMDTILTHPATAFEHIRLPPYSGKVVLVDRTRSVSGGMRGCEVTADGTLRDNPELNVALADWLKNGCWNPISFDTSLVEIEAGDTFVDIAQQVVDKGNALTAMRQFTTAPIYHIGDGSNDIPTEGVVRVRTVAVSPTCSWARKGNPDSVMDAETGPQGLVKALAAIKALHC